MRSRFSSAAALSAAVLAVAGCATAPPEAPPAQPLPAAWAEAATVPADARPVERLWWNGFGSAQLARLVDEAEAGSADLRIAAQRLRQAEIARELVGVSRLPVAATIETGRTATRVDGADTPAATRNAASTALGVAVSYEVDLWGRVAAEQRASDWTLRASRHDLDTARLTLQSAVARAYLQWLSLGERLQLARANVEIAQRVLRVVEARRRAGSATALEVSQQRTALQQQQTALVPLEVQLRQTESALALLLGRMPQSGAGLVPEDFDALAVPEVRPLLPAELLLRRPDLAAAEARLAAASADVVAARAALLPTLSLSARAVASTDSLLGLADPLSSSALGLQLVQTLFDRGRLRLHAESVRSRWLALVEDYRATVRVALKEVDDALSHLDRARRQDALQRELVAQARRSLQLAEARYRAGSGDLLSVLDAQRALAASEDAWIGYRLGRAEATLDLWKALGGGWEADAGGIVQNENQS